MPSDHISIRQRAGLAVLIAAGAAALPLRASDDASELKRLIDQIAKGEGTEVDDASDRLVERVIGPVAEAFGKLESRPAEEQRRLRAVLARIASALRVRLFRADLDEADGALFDRFYQQYPQLVSRLFDPNFKTRMEAIPEVPLQPNSAAGLLLAAKVDDEDEEVAMSALEAVGELRDGVVARRLAKYVRGATAAIRDGQIGADDPELAATVVVIVGRCGLVLADCPGVDATAAIGEVVSYFGKSRYRAFVRVADLLEALGKRGDEAVAPVLLEFLNDRELRSARPAPQGGTVYQVVGDAALLSLLSIYKLKPEAFGFVRLTDESAVVDAGDAIQAPKGGERAAGRGGGVFFGFRDAASRERGVRAFVEWHEQNAKLPAGDRKPPASQPVEP